MGFWLEQKKKKDRFLLWFRPKTPTLRGMVRGIEEPWRCLCGYQYSTGTLTARTQTPKKAWEVQCDIVSQLEKKGVKEIVILGWYYEAGRWKKFLNPSPTQVSVAQFLWTRTSFLPLLMWNDLLDLSLIQRQEIRILWTSVSRMLTRCLNSRRTTAIPPEHARSHLNSRRGSITCICLCGDCLAPEEGNGRSRSQRLNVLFFIFKQQPTSWVWPTGWGGREGRRRNYW